MYRELDNFKKEDGNLALEVLGDGVKAYGMGYLLSQDGRLWTKLLDLTPFNEQQLLRSLTSKAKDKTKDEFIYRLSRPQGCPNCDSEDISIEFDVDYEMSDSYWVCICGWEDARATESLWRQQKAA